MPRIRQYAERYAVKDFWKEIDRCCPLAGIQSNNAVALEEKTGVDHQTLRNYRKGKPAELQKGENRNAGKRPSKAGDHPPPKPGGDSENPGVLREGAPGVCEGMAVI